MPTHPVVSELHRYTPGLRNIRYIENQYASLGTATIKKPLQYYAVTRKSARKILFCT